MSLIKIKPNTAQIRDRVAINRALLANRIEDWLTLQFNLASTDLEAGSIIVLAIENDMLELAHTMQVDMINGKQGIEI
jgi:hypothetical protein